MLLYICYYKYIKHVLIITYILICKKYNEAEDFNCFFNSSFHIMLNDFVKVLIIIYV